MTYTYHFHQEMEPQSKEIWLQEILRQFGLEVTLEMVQPSEYTTTLELRFAAGTEPDVIAPWSNEKTREWGMAGYLLSLQSHLDELPNMEKNFDATSWAHVRQAATSPDGNIYAYVNANPLNISKGWAYRRKVLNELGLEFPGTTTDLVGTGRALKRAFPESWPLQSWAKADGGAFVPDEYLLAWRTDDGWYIDPDTNSVTYGPRTDKYREALKFVHGLHQEDLVADVDPNFAMLSDLLAEGRSHIMYFDMGLIDRVNGIVNQDDPAAQFEIWDRGPVTAPGMAPMTARNSLWYEAGTIAATIDDEVLARWLEYLDILFSGRGVIAKSGPANTNLGGVDEHGGHLGIVPYQMRMSSPIAEAVYDMGFLRGYGLPEIVGIDTGYEEALSRQNSMLEYPFIRDSSHIIWRLTVRDSELLMGVQALIDSVRDEYGQKFATGSLDPSNDGNWMEYLDSLNRAGLGQAQEILDLANADYIPY